MMYLVSVSQYLYLYIFLSVSVHVPPLLSSALYAIRFKHKGQANKQIVAHYACCLSRNSTQNRNNFYKNKIANRQKNKSFAKYLSKLQDLT